MTRDRTAPCIIGTARRTWRQQPAPEPLDMWEDLAREAAVDAGVPGAVRSIQSLQVVYCQSWEYDDPCARLAERLAADPTTSNYSGLGGSVPIRLLGEAATAMGRDGLELALVVGAEALATRRRLPDPGWSHAPAKARPFPIELERNELRHGIHQAYLTFALLDTARRARLGRTPARHTDELGHLLAPLTEVAASDPEHAWFPIARQSSEITTPSATNRMVATPYTKLMTAFMDVDMAAAVLLASDAGADRLGVPAERRVYLRGLGFGEEPPAIASRPDLWRSPALGAAGRAALGGLSIDDVAHLDLYSCFASSLSFACDALGLSRDRGLTVTGGLPYHGGPGSNYTTHSLAAMTDLLRADPGSYGLVTGIGMHLPHHAASVWSTQSGGVSPPEPCEPLPATPVAAEAEGPARVVSFSSVHGREGPEWSALICDLPGGARCYARLEDPVPDEVDLVGETVSLAPVERGVNLASR